MKVHSSVYETVSLPRENGASLKADFTRSEYSWKQIDLSLGTSRMDGMSVNHSFSVESAKQLASTLMMLAALEFEKKEKEEDN